MEVLQVQSELQLMRALYRERSPKRVLEIGSWEGGTLLEWLAGDLEQVVSVDIDHDRLTPELLDEPDLYLLTGDSTSEAMKADVRALAPYDWIFVDGNHDYDAVRSDVQLAMECAGPDAVLLLHDIADQPGDGPARVLAEFDQSRVTTFIDPKQERWGHGIGVVQL